MRRRIALGTGKVRTEPRHAVAEIRTIELRICIDLACQEAFAKWAKRNETNPKFLKRWHHRLFRLSPKKRVLALERSDGLNCMGTADRLRARFREAEVLHLAFLNQVLYCTRNIFDWNIQVDTMLVEKIDGIDIQPPQRSLCDLFDVLWSTVKRAPLAAVIGIGFPPELRCDYDLSAKRSKGLTDKRG